MREFVCVGFVTDMVGHDQACAKFRASGFNKRLTRFTKGAALLALQRPPFIGKVKRPQMRTWG